MTDVERFYTPGCTDKVVLARYYDALAEDYRKLGVLYSGTSQVCEQRGIRIAALEAELADIKSKNLLLQDLAISRDVETLQIRVAALEAALKEAATVVWGCRNFMLAGREREFVYAAKRYYEVLGSVPDEVIRATSDDIDDDSESETTGNDHG